MRATPQQQVAADVTGDGGPGPTPDEMQAVVQDRYGPADVLGVQTVDLPSLGADEVLLEVHAAGIDRGTWHLMTGQPYLVRLAGFGVLRPRNRVPGLDVAGTVVAVGPEVTRFGVGDEVFGIARGSLAQYAAASQDKLAHRPAGVSSEQAAVATVSGITALQALTDVGHLEPGQRVLVVGASGGVGTYAVQLAKALGAHVTAVAGTRNLDLVRSIGADEVIDHRHQAIDEGDRHYDLVLDIGGRNRLRRLRRVLTPRGTLVIVGGEGANRITGGIGRQLRAMALSPFVGQRLTSLMSKEHHRSIEELARFLAEGSVVPVIGRTYALEATPEAMRRLEAGEAHGKSVILVARGRS
jgi:NADPH:quinone reductase-like Zn-dependent oxidoreductase